MNYNLIISFILVFVAQTLSYFQLQGQFLHPWMKNNPIVLSFLGFPISLLLINFTKYCADGFGGQVWPGRLIGFAVGAIVFAILTVLGIIALAIAILIGIVKLAIKLSE